MYRLARRVMQNKRNRNKMKQFGGGVMEYDYMYSEDGNVYYMKCVYKGHAYSYIKFDTETGIFTLYGDDDEQIIGTVPLNKF